MLTPSFLFTLVGQTQQQSPGGGGFSTMLLMILSLVFLFYILILRPQKRQEQERKQMLGNLEKGDKVVTIGGMYGTIVDIDDNATMLTLEVAKNIKIDFTKSSISQIVKKKKQP